jgi:hypothetical protein
MSKLSLVAAANEHVAILDVCSRIGMNVPETSYGKSVKVHCPFGIYHADHGQESSFRIFFDSNTAYCFAGCGFFSPVWLAALAWDRQVNSVAEELLESIGYRPLSLEDSWEKSQEHEVVPDVSALAEALKIYCGHKILDWEVSQFSYLAQTLSGCLALLSRVKTEQQAWQWLEATKSIMIEKSNSQNTN